MGDLLVRRARAGPWIATLLSLALALVYFQQAGEPGIRFLLGLDDGYIHAQLAENLVASGVLGLNEGSGGGGSSSLLWTLLISALVALGVPGDLAAGLLSLFSLGFAVGGQNVALGLTGMESLLFAGLLFAGFHDAILGRRWNGALFFSLASLVRVEAVLAAGSFFVVRLWMMRRNSGRRLERSVLAKPYLQLAVVVVAAMAGVSVLAALGQEFPSTLGARRWLYGMNESLIPGREQLTILLPYLSRDLWARLCVVQGPGGAVGQIWGALVLALSVAGGVYAIRTRGLLASIPIYMVLQTIFVVFVLGSDSHLSRYLAPVWMLMPLLVVLGWEAVTCRFAGRWWVLVQPIAVVLLLAAFVPQGFHWAVWHKGSTAHLRTVHLAMAESVARAVALDESVAAFDVGLLAYRSGRRVVDMGGVTDKRMLRALWRKETPRVLDAMGVDYVVLPEGVDPGSRGVYGVRLGFDARRLRLIGRVAVQARDLGYLNPTKVAMPALGLYETRR